MSADDEDLGSELIEADGEGAELFDAPTLFYLTYREDIERWHALKERTNQAVREYLVGLREDIADIVESQNLTVGEFKTGSRYRSLLVWPMNTHNSDDGEPPLAVGLRWSHHRPALEEAGDAPRVGVRAARGHDQMREQFLSAGHPDTRQLRQEHGYRSDKRWPAFREVPASPNWWADLDRYRNALLEVLEETLSIFGDGLRSVYPDT